MEDGESRSFERAREAIAAANMEYMKDIKALKAKYAFGPSPCSSVSCHVFVYESRIIGMLTDYPALKPTKANVPE